MDRKICLTEAEFVLLASGMGIEKMFAFAVNNEASMTEQQVNQNLFRMVKKGFLQVDREQYAIAPDLKDFFQKLKEAKQIVTLYTCSGNMPMKCIYRNTNLSPDAALLELGDFTGSIFKASQGNMEQVLDEYLDDLIGKALLQESNEVLQGKTLEESEMEGDHILEKQLQMLYHESERKLEKQFETQGLVCILSERNAENGEVLRRIYLLSRLLYDEIVVQTQTAKEKYRFRKDLVKNLFER